MIKPFRFIDLFSGLGGFHLAAHNLGGRCVLSSEINLDLHDAYEQNFGNRPLGDLREIQLDSIPDHELLCAGFPCQPFSKAGNQKGWRDTVRGTLFFNIAQVLELKRPNYVLLENVANFAKHDNGNTYQQVINTLNELGYETSAAKLSPHDFGIPQHRERLFIVGTQSGLEGFKWPEPTREITSVFSILEEKPTIGKLVSPHILKCLEVWQVFLDSLPKELDVPSYPIWAMEFGATYPIEQPIHRLTVKELQCYRGVFGVPLTGMSRAEIYNNLPSHALRENGFPSWKLNFINKNREFFLENKASLTSWLERIKPFSSSLQKLEWNNKGGEKNIWSHLVQVRASGLRVRRPNYAPALVAASDSQIPIIPWKQRYFTVRECARLQSMDDLIMPASMYTAYEALGNAVNVKLVSLILNQLLCRECKELDFTQYDELERATACV